MLGSSIVEALGNAVKGVSECFKTAKSKQLETEIIKEKRSLKKAVDCAEKIIEISFKYYPLMEETDREDFIANVKKFRKYD